MINAKEPSHKVLGEIQKCVPTDSQFRQVWMVVGMPNTGKSTVINSLIAGSLQFLCTLLNLFGLP